MKSIYTILAADSTLAAALYNEGRIYQMQAPDQQGAPFVVITDVDLTNPHDTNDGQNLDEFNVSISVWGKELFTSADNSGADNLATLVRAALHGIDGTYAGEEVKINFLSQNTSNFPNEGTDKYLIEQDYQVFRKR